MARSNVVPPRFLIFVAVLAAAAATLIPAVGFERGALSAFDVAATIFLLSLISLFDDNPGEMRAAAERNDANRLFLLLVSVVLTLVVVAATVSLLTGKDQLTLPDKLLVTGSLMLVWFFANAVFALHYAHLYYLSGTDGDCGGLEFRASSRRTSATSSTSLSPSGSRCRPPTSRSARGTSGGSSPCRRSPDSSSTCSCWR